MKTICLWLQCVLLAASLLPAAAQARGGRYDAQIRARVAELLKAPRGGDEVVRQSRAFRVLERALQHITPLNLLDPRAENFRPEACRTYHDITRFAHEKAMEELFQMSAGRQMTEQALECERRPRRQP